MPAANPLRAQDLRSRIEAALASRVPAALSPAVRTVRQGILSGIGAVDTLLPYGVSPGVITEFVGAESSGRTSLSLAYLAAIFRSDAVCAWVDVADCLCVESAAANGIDLDRLLWVRCGQPRSHGHVSTSQAMLRPVAEPTVPVSSTGGGSPHPRSEGKDMPEAIGKLLQAHGGFHDHQLRRARRMIGTPGAPNRPLSRPAGPREEQVNSDRLPPRRGENLNLAPRCAEAQPRRTPQIAFSEKRPLHKAAATSLSSRGSSSLWPALDQAIRATDLLLQGGGFSAIVLDLGSVPPEYAWRIPLATWFRFRAACEHSRTSLLLLTRHPCARSSAELVVRLEAAHPEAANCVVTGIHYQAAVERNRSEENAARIIPIRKPPQSQRPGQWTSKALWSVHR